MGQFSGIFAILSFLAENLVKPYCFLPANFPQPFHIGIVIQRQAGHKAAPMLRRHIRWGEVFCENAAASLSI